MVPFFFATATFFSTLLGGAFAIRYQHRLNLLMGFSAGVLLGVVGFDILPEIIAQVKNNGYDAQGIMIALVAGFLVFHVVEKLLVVHHANEDQYAEHKHPQVGVLSALALAGHSFMDGVAIGLGFKVSQSVGVIVSLAVITHDFTDGLNSVTVMLNHHNPARRTRHLLILDAAAPILGILSTHFFSPSQQFLVMYMGFFAGFLLYIGASDILPEAHSKDSSLMTILMTLAGTLLSFALSRLL